MRKITVFLAIICLIGLNDALAQQTEYELIVPNSEAFTDGYTTGIHSGARGVSGPYDLDGDGHQEILVTDYTGGGRVHVIENAGPDTWELVYSTPWIDSTATVNAARYAVGGDLDNDGYGEIYVFSGFASVDSTVVPGLYVYENTGSDNDYGTVAASIYDFPNDPPDRYWAEQMIVQDIDGDGFQELLFGHNGANNRHDNWYILSVSGDIGTGFEVWVEEARLSSRATEDFDPVNRGGGSPYSILPGDFDGDGTWDLMMHSWNSFNFTTGQVAGADSYTFPDTAGVNSWIHATPEDHVSLFGGVVVDIDGDGNDELFYPRFQAGNVALINYSPGDNTLEITEDNITVDLIEGFTTLGIAAGDLDGDGYMELFGSGPAFGATSWLAGLTPSINIAEYIPGPGKAQAGDPTDPANYAVQSLDISMPHDSLAFDKVFRDSAGVATEYYENGTQGPEFVAKLAYLGDADGDGDNELALSFQGVDDTTYVYDEVWSDADSAYVRTVRTATANENRGFLRVVSARGVSVSIADERVVLPNDYKLEANYPNPFNPSTTFSFTLPLDKQISVKIYDATGRLVQTLINDQVYSKGTHQVTWDAAGLASGTYLYTLEYGNFRQTRSMVLLK